jgi:hypothetical protein
MRDEYDFSKGTRGKFYRPDTKLNLPIYLEDEVMAFVEKIAEKKGTDMSSVVNKLIRGDMLISDAME